MGMIKTPLVRQVARGLARILGDMAQFCDAAAGPGPHSTQDDGARGDWIRLAAVLRDCTTTIEAKL